MSFTAEQLEVLKSCKTPEELIAKAAEAGFQMDEAQAQQLLESSEFIEIEPDDVTAAGGACNSLKDYEYYCDICGKKAAVGPGYYEFLGRSPSGRYYSKKACISCHADHKDDPRYRWLPRKS